MGLTSGSYQGDITVGLDQGLKVTIPNELLVVPDAYVAPSGQVETNTSASALLIAPTLEENTVDVPILGRPFFSAAYLMVDLDAQTFTLWQANATSDERLVTVGGACLDAPKVNDAPTNTTKGPAATTSATSLATSTSSEPPNASKSPSAGVIAGIAVGAAVGLGVLAAILAFSLLRKRRRDALARSQVDAMYNKYGHESDHSYNKNGFSSPLQRYPGEMAAAQDQSYELLAHDRPLEAPGKPWDSRPVELPVTRFSKPDI